MHLFRGVRPAYSWDLWEINGKHCSKPEAVQRHQVSQWHFGKLKVLRTKYRSRGKPEVQVQEQSAQRRKARVWVAVVAFKSLSFPWSTTTGSLNPRLVYLTFLLRFRINKSIPKPTIKHWSLNILPETPKCENSRLSLPDPSNEDPELNPSFLLRLQSSTIGSHLPNEWPTDWGSDNQLQPPKEMFIIHSSGGPPLLHYKVVHSTKTLYKI